MTGDTHERRRAPRVDMDVEARVHAGLGFRLARCRNASLVGLGLELFTPLEPGTPIVVSLEMNGKTLRLRGELVRDGVYPEGLAGIRITDEDSATLGRLFAWVRDNAAAQPPHHGFFENEWAYSG